MAVSRKTIVLRCVGAVAGFLAFAFIAGGVIGYLDASGVVLELGTIAFWFAALVAVTVMVAAIWVGALWMRSIDEAAREAHKAAWYWGGSSGMAVGGVLMILAILPGAGSVALPVVMDGRTDPAIYAATGAFALMILMLIGYGVVWAWWWLARR
ncbi:hypothetical protein BH10PSE1_BH10PSE1_10800 [soil metagenome]